VHPPAQLLAQCPLLKRRHPERRHEIAPTQLCEHTRVDRVGLARERRDVTDLARVRDLNVPAGRGQLVADPDRAAHHLNARPHVDTDEEHEPHKPVLVRRHDTLAGDRAALRQRTPRRPSIRPVDPDILHRRASLRGLNYRTTLSLLGGPPS
jgi:hypothetical protein